MLGGMSSPLPPSDRPVALVTGPTAGIGLEFARQLAASGHDVVLVARNEARLNEVALELHQEFGAHCEVLVADLADRDQLAVVEARLAAPSGPIDLLVNNAGFGLKDRFLVNSVEQEQMLLDVLVTAVMRLSHAALGPMAARGSGAVLNVSSVAGLNPAPGIGYYGVSKAALLGLTVQLAAELAPRVRVNAVAPAVVRTRFAAALYEADEAAAAAAYPLGRLGEPEDVAAAAAFLTSADAGWVTGQVVVLDGGMGLRASL